jgi:hypothetical protein
MILAGDLRNCQMGRNGLSSCQVGNGKRPGGGLVYCQGRSVESSDFQEGNDMGSIDLIDYQVGSKKIPKFLGGQGEGDETIMRVSGAQK